MFKLLRLGLGEVGSMLVVVSQPHCKTLGRSPLSPVLFFFFPLLCKVGKIVIILVNFRKYWSYRLKKACGISKGE